MNNFSVTEKLMKIVDGTIVNTGLPEFLRGLLKSTQKNYGNNSVGTFAHARKLGD